MFTLSKMGQYVITSSNDEDFSKTRTFPNQAKSIPTCKKSALVVFQFLQSILYIQTYIYTCIYATEHVDTWNMLTSTAVIVNMFQVSTRSAAYTHTYIYTIKKRLKYVYIYVYMFRID